MCLTNLWFYPYFHLTKQIIARLDDPVPEYFKSPNFLEQLEWLTKTLTPPHHHLSGVNGCTSGSDHSPSPPPIGTHNFSSHFPHPLALHPQMSGLPVLPPPPNVHRIPFLTPPPGYQNFMFGPRRRPPHPFPMMNFFSSPPTGIAISPGGIMSINSQQQPIISSSRGSGNGSTSNNNVNTNSSSGKLPGSLNSGNYNTAGGQCYLPMSPPWR